MTDVTKGLKTTHAIRGGIQRLKATILELTQKYNLNPNTVLKWKHRKSVEDAPMGPKRIRTGYYLCKKKK